MDFGLHRKKLEKSSQDGSPINQQTAMLWHSYRFGKDSGIGNLAKEVNLGKVDEACTIMKAQSTPIYSKYKTIIDSVN
jgi:exodeoxyribonuclease V alpha subunit